MVNKHLNYFKHIRHTVYKIYRKTFTFCSVARLYRVLGVTPSTFQACPIIKWFKVSAAFWCCF